MRAVLLEPRARVARHHHVAREQRDVSAELDRVAAREGERLAEVVVLQRLEEFNPVATLAHADHRRRVRRVHRAILGGARDRNLAVDGPVDRVDDPELRRAPARRLCELDVRAAAEERAAVHLERAEAAAEHLRAVHGDLLGDWRAVQRDGRFEERVALGADDQRAAHHEDVVRVEAEVLPIKLRRPLHDEHVHLDVGVEEDALPRLNPHRLAVGLDRDRRVAAAPRRPP